MTNTTQEELLPCPFCGSEPDEIAHDAYMIGCNKCPVSPHVDFFSRADSIAAWNRRTPPAEQPAAEGMTDAILQAKLEAYAHSAEICRIERDHAVKGDSPNASANRAYVILRGLVARYGGEPNLTSKREQPTVKESLTVDAAGLPELPEPSVIDAMFCADFEDRIAAGAKGDHFDLTKDAYGHWHSWHTQNAHTGFHSGFEAGVAYAQQVVAQRDAEIARLSADLAGIAESDEQVSETISRLRAQAAMDREERNAFLSAIEQCLQMLLTESDLHGALFRAEEILRNAKADTAIAKEQKCST